MYKPNFEAELIDAYVLHELTLVSIFCNSGNFVYAQSVAFKYQKNRA